LGSIYLGIFSKATNAPAAKSNFCDVHMKSSKKRTRFAPQ